MSTLDFPHTTYLGPPIDDAGIIGRLPSEYAAFLEHSNGVIAYSGGLHIRGACLDPAWHSIRAALDGPDAIPRLFASVTESDTPFAQEVCGDQFVLRGDIVHRLAAETGELQSLEATFGRFLEQVLADPVRVLGLEPLLGFLQQGGRLEPGQLLSVYPPFWTTAASEGVTLTAVAVADRLEFLASFAARVAEVPAGTPVETRVLQPVQRRIVGFHQDEEQHWVADLDCGHPHHVRHDPPWQVRPWVITPEGRTSHLGTVLVCARCADGS